MPSWHLWRCGEAAAYYKKRGKTLWDAMIDMYEKYGYYKDDVISITHKGIEGLEKIKSTMDGLRTNPPSRFGNYDVTVVRDYEQDTIKNLITGEEGKTGLPKSNVLYYELTSDAWLCVRPSGDGAENQDIFWRGWREPRRCGPEVVRTGGGCEKLFAE